MLGSTGVFCEASREDCARRGRGLLKGRHSAAAASWDANTVFLVVGISCNSKGSESRLRMEGLLHGQAVKDYAA